MADRAPDRTRRFGRASWWKFVFGGFLIGVGLYLFNRPQTLMERPAMANAEAEQSSNGRTEFEPSDWSPAPILLIYAGILALLVISAFAVVIAYPHSLPDVSRTLRINPPGPRLQTNDAADLQRFRAEEDKQLNGYHWIDKQKGVVRIPIGEAMQKLARTGIDGFPKAQP
jgi:hypothetical protein